MALRVAVVIVAASTMGYVYVYNSVKQSNLQQLEKYVQERGARESIPFLNIQNNLRIIADAYLKNISGPIPADNSKEFNRLFVRSPDGAWRRNPKGYDIDTQSGSYMSSRATLTLDDERRSLAAYRLTTAYGSAWINQMTDVFLASMDGIASTYLPGINWYTDVAPNLDFSKLSWVVAANKINNPSRAYAWTGIYFDTVAKSWMATCILPIDVNGKFSHYAGGDLLLDDILKRTSTDQLDGTYNLIFRSDGVLISHPKYVDEIKKHDGQYSLISGGDTHLKALFNTVSQSDHEHVIELKEYGEYLGVAHIEGPGWHFVTVFPKKIISATASEAAETFLWLGVGSLILELIILAAIIRGQVSVPLRNLSSKAARIRDGDLSTRCEVTTEDELGDLASSFNDMANAIQSNSEVLRQNNVALENRIAERTAVIERALSEQHQFMDMLTHELKTPLSVVRMALGVMKVEGRTKHHADQALADMSDVIERCRQMDQLEQRKLVLHAQRCRIDEVLSELRLNSGKPDRLSVAIDSLPEIVADQQLLRIVIGNLVNNAIKYSQPETIIDIHAESAPRNDKPGIRITIQNQPGAAGLPDPDQVFVKYYRSPGAHGKTGSGLGLYLVRNITELLGGHVAYDVVQEQVRFTLWIPC